MRRFRFHLGTLVILVLLIGVGFGALRESNDTWDSSIFSLTLGMLLISILLAIHRAEKSRAFWLAFALFGWIYLGLSLVPSIESRLITTKALAYLDSKVADRIVQGIFGWNISSSKPTPIDVSHDSLSIVHFPNRNVEPDDDKLVRGTVYLTSASAGTASGTTENFIRIGHSLFALLAGWLGGQLSRRLCRNSIYPGISTPVESASAGHPSKSTRTCLDEPRTW